MPSFAILASLTSLALASFTSAAPAPGGPVHEVDVADIKAIVTAVVEDVNVANSHYHHARNIPQRSQAPCPRIFHRSS
ncbi:hypothetical protein ONZ45_g17827 [Pleurotus djamor]|nr:hypothetical protein ONZ45_g17827 [Pleurotus djamor]